MRAEASKKYAQSTHNPPWKLKLQNYLEKKSNFIWMASNSHAYFQIALTIDLKEYGSFLHKWLLGANMAWSSLPSELTPTQYQMAVKLPLNWWGTAGWGEPGTVCGPVFQQFTQPTIVDCKPFWLSKKNEHQGEMKRTSGSISFRPLPPAQRFLSVCYQHALLRKVEAVFF